MNTNKPINIRPATQNDLKQLCLIINEIIVIGGSTAFEEVLIEEEFDAIFLSGEAFISCLLAENTDGQVLGFQSLCHHKKLPDDWADIATFARVEPKTHGVGTSLFQATLELARQLGLTCINATIRADNISGLSYYAKIGFENYSVDKAVPLQDGTPVDRISRKFEKIG